MSCSSAEIAEKKRIALEKLNAKKLLVENNKNGSISTTNKLPTSSDVSKFYNNNKKNVSNPANKADNFLQAINENKAKLNRFQPYKHQQPPHNENRNTKNWKNWKKVAPQENNEFASIFVRKTLCNFCLITVSRFGAKLTGFNQKLIDVFKTIPSKTYDPKVNLWSFDIKDYDLVLERVGELTSVVTIEGIPKNVLQLFSKSEQQLNYSVLASLESTIAESLLPFQREGVCFGISKHGRLLIGDEMGLGKTYQALAIAEFYKDDWPLLICTTASIRSSWISHIYKLFPYIACQHVVNITSNQDYFGDAKIVVTSYPMMEKIMDSLLEKKFGVLIMDESHSLKNNKAKCTIVADRLSNSARRIILLSGTPALSRPSELFTQLKMIDRKFWNFMDYTTRYCDGKQSAFGWNCSGQSNLEELNLILNRKFMIRRTKAEVLPQLAEKFRETVFLDSSLVLSNDEVKKQFNKLTLNLSQSKGHEKEELLFRFYTETAIAKSKAVCVYIQKILKDNIKFIVFAHHKHMIKEICNCLENSEISFIKIDGNTKHDLRTKYVEEFQNDETCRVAILSLKSCNSGITLTAAQLIIFAELDWNPSTLVQAESRAHRIGQQSTVTCRYLLAKHTVDDIIWDMLRNKQDVLNKAGLFCEDLQNGEHINARTSSSAGNIDKYVVKTPKKETILNTKVEKNSNEIEAKVLESVTDEDLKHLLDDDDEDFGDLVY